MAMCVLKEALAIRLLIQVHLMMTVMSVRFKTEHRHSSQLICIIPDHYYQVMLW